MRRLLFGQSLYYGLNMNFYSRTALLVKGLFAVFELKATIDGGRSSV